MFHQLFLKWLFIKSVYYIHIWNSNVGYLELKFFICKCSNKQNDLAFGIFSPIILCRYFCCLLLFWNFFSSLVHNNVLLLQGSRVSTSLGGSTGHALLPCLTQKAHKNVQTKNIHSCCIFSWNSMESTSSLPFFCRCLIYWSRISILHACILGIIGTKKWFDTAITISEKSIDQINHRTCPNLLLLLSIFLFLLWDNTYGFIRGRWSRKLNYLVSINE